MPSLYYLGYDDATDPVEPYVASGPTYSSIPITPTVVTYVEYLQGIVVNSLPYDVVSTGAGGPGTVVYYLGYDDATDPVEPYVPPGGVQYNDIPMTSSVVDYVEYLQSVIVNYLDYPTITSAVAGPGTVVYYLGYDDATDPVEPYVPPGGVQYNDIPFVSPLSNLSYVSSVVSQPPSVLSSQEYWY